MALMNFSNDFEGVKFEDLEVGCVFLREDTCYIKTQFKYNPQRSINAVNLANGEFDCFDNIEKVLPVRSTLHIEKVGVM